MKTKLIILGLVVVAGGLFGAALLVVRDDDSWAVASQHAKPGEVIARTGLNPEQQAQADKAFAALEAGKCEEASRIYDSMGDKENAAAALLLKAMLGKGDEGLAAIDDVIHRYSGTLQAGLAEYHRIRLLRDAGREEDFVQALKEFVRTHPKGPMRPEAQVHLAMVLQARGEGDEAIACLEQLVKETHKQGNIYTPAVQGLVMLYEQRGDSKKSDQLLAGLIKGVENGKLHHPGDLTGTHRDATLQALRDIQNSRMKMGPPSGKMR